MSDRNGAHLWRNPVTLIGAALGLFAALFIVSFLLLDVVLGQKNPYLGLFTYLVFPGVMVVGVLLSALGLWIARRRHRRQPESLRSVHYYPRINLNLASHRRAMLVGGLGTLLAIPLVGVLSYEGYHYTDSNEFCGLVCHGVMEPQYTAYLQSPHASVNCAECHIGSGATWYVKSKLSGVRQVLAVATDSFSRPIPPAIRELRPATETCRECHWPAKFYGDQLVTIDHFASDEDNTHRPLRMLVKTGGSDASTGPPSGIHWHMTLGFQIEYVAVDDHLQEIPWVRTKDERTGEVRTYRSDGKPHTDPPPDGTRRVVDCMDCHNRPTHIFRSPDRAVDIALNVDPSLRSLPFAKREATRALVQAFPSKADGLTGVVNALHTFYRDEMPEVWAARRADVDRLTKVAQEIYRTNFFPEMKVNWRTYPDNIGHKFFPGCFRCHEGQHVDAAGGTISHACSVCHEFLVPASADDPNALVQSGQFKHPIPLEGSHAMLRCDRCHTGGVAPATTCEGCHTPQQQFRAGTLASLSAFGIAAEPMMGTVDCEGCHDLTEPTNIETIDALCRDCHEDDEARFVGMLASWKREADRLLADAEAKTDDEGRKILQAIKNAGPLHNMDATRSVVQSLIGKPQPSASP